MVFYRIIFPCVVDSLSLQRHLPLYEDMRVDSNVDTGGLSRGSAFTVLTPWTVLGASSSVPGKFFSRLSPRMDPQSLGEGLLSLARERLFSSAAVDEHSHWLTHRGFVWLWRFYHMGVKGASGFILGRFNWHFCFLLRSGASPWVVRSPVFLSEAPLTQFASFSLTNWFLMNLLLLLLLCPFMCYRNFGWEDTCNFNITEFIF